jgi:hypothetical protein
VIRQARIGLLCSVKKIVVDVVVKKNEKGLWHVCERRKNLTECLVRERYHFEDLVVGERIILKLIKCNFNNNLPSTPRFFKWSLSLRFLGGVYYTAVNRVL